MKKYEIFLELPPDIVLKAIARKNTNWNLTGIHGLVYNENKIIVYYKPEGRNCRNPIFLGTVLPDTNGSVLVGVSGTPLLTTLLMWGLRGIAALQIAKVMIENVISTLGVFTDIKPFYVFLISASLALELIGVMTVKSSQKKIVSFFERINASISSFPRLLLSMVDESRVS